MPTVDGGIILLNFFMIYLLLQVEDLPRMFRLFSRINGGLPPVSKMFQEVLSGSFLLYSMSAK
jgi:hypothetical protein